MALMTTSENGKNCIMNTTTAVAVLTLLVSNANVDAQELVDGAILRAPDFQADGGWGARLRAPAFQADGGWGEDGGWDETEEEELVDEEETFGEEAEEEIAEVGVEGEGEVAEFICRTRVCL